MLAYKISITLSLCFVDDQISSNSKPSSRSSSSSTEWER